MSSVVNSNQQASPDAVLVVGLGKTGYSAARHYLSSECPVTVVDSRDNPPYRGKLLQEFPDADIRCGTFDAAFFSGFGQLLLSPGVSLAEPAVQAALNAGADVFGDIELFARSVSAPVIAITGSNGKSTVTQLVGDMLNAAGIDARVGGNLGTPVLDLMSDEEPEVYVLELSSFQLETTHSLRPKAAVVLNISEDHMDRYASLDDYARAKTSIYRYAEHCIVNRDCELAMPESSDHCASRITFGVDDAGGPDDYGIHNDTDGSWVVLGGQKLLNASELVLQGGHNLLNVQTAMALVKACGYELNSAMLHCVRNFGGLPHRMQVVCRNNGVTWINDSKGTNVGATVAALNGLDRPVVLIAGGQGKNADFSPLAKATEAHVKLALLFGEDVEPLQAALHKSCPTMRVKNLCDAVARAMDVVVEDDVVLFSPACASFDMFANFEARGDAFIQQVEKVTSCRQ